MTQCARCRNLPARIKKTGISEIPELNHDLELMFTDGRLWINKYECKICGLTWKESFYSSGHGEIPCIEKDVES